jgi:biotin transport system substrate-specific component
MDALVPALSARYLTALDRRAREALLVCSGAFFVAALAQVRVPLPFTPVPITGQTFAVLLVGAALGSKRGAASLLAYLGMGALGLPFFAGGAAGVKHLLGPTAGYLLGFVVAAWLVGWLAERGLERRLPQALLVFLAGEVAIYLLGVGWLTFVLGSLQKALLAGFFPFLIGDAIKCVAAALALPAAWQLVRRAMG